MSENAPDTWKEWKCGTEKNFKNPQLLTEKMLSVNNKDDI